MSNNKILYVEPNNLTDKNHDNIPFNSEDYSIAVDIEVVVPDRSDWGSIDRYNINSTDATKTISFLGGTNGMLTTSFTDISGLDGAHQGNRETLGIKSIHIDYTANFFPKVKINFTDVKGSALMQPEEEAYVNSLKSKTKTMTQGSFFRSLFNFPYPMFRLKVKGFYGKPVTYNLAVESFYSDFDANSGSFNVEVNFIGYLYGVYADLPFKYLLLAPYINYPDSINGGMRYWNANRNTRGGKYVFPDGIPMPTFLELKERIFSSSSKVEKKLSRSLDVKKFNQNTTLIGKLKDLISVYDRLMTAIGNDYSDNQYIFVHKDKTTYEDIYNNFIETLKEVNKYYTENSRFDVNAYSALMSNPDVCYNKEGDGWALKVNISDSNFKPESSIGRNIIATLGQKGTSISGIFLKKNDLRARAAKRIKKHTEDNDELNKKITSQKKAETQKVLGFNPTSKNLVELVFAHLDCFMHEFYSCLDQIKNNNRTFDTLSINVSNTDANQKLSNSSFVPPFPLVSDSTSGKVVYPSMVGTVTYETMPELLFVENIVATAQGILKDIQEAGDDFTSFPALISDVIAKKNPYSHLNGSSDNVLGDIYAVFINRLFTLLGYQTNISGDTITSGPYSGNKISEAVTSFAQTEAYNVFKVFQSNEQVYKKLYEVTSEEIINFIVNSATTGNSLANANNKFSYDFNGTFKLGEINNNSEIQPKWLFGKANDDLVLYDFYEDITNKAKSIYDSIISDGVCNTVNGTALLYPTGKSSELCDDAQAVFSMSSDFHVDKANEAFETYKSKITENRNNPAMDNSIYNPYTSFAKDNTYKCQYFNNTDANLYWNGCSGISAQKVLDPQYDRSKLNFKALLANGSQLFGSNFFKKQDIQTRGFLFLLSLPLDFTKILAELPHERDIDTIPVAVALFLGGLLLNKDAVSVDNVKIANNNLFLSGNSLTFLKSGDTKNEYTGFNTDRVMSLKWTAKKKLIKYFNEWISGTGNFVNNSYLNLETKLGFLPTASNESFVKAYNVINNTTATTNDYCVAYIFEGNNTTTHIIIDKILTGTEDYNNFTELAQSINSREQSVYTLKKDNAEYNVSGYTCTTNAFNTWLKADEKNQAAYNRLKLISNGEEETYLKTITGTKNNEEKYKVIFGSLGYNINLTAGIIVNNNDINFSYTDNLGFVLNVLTDYMQTYSSGSLTLKNGTYKKYYVFSKSPIIQSINGYKQFATSGEALDYAISQGIGPISNTLGFSGDTLHYNGNVIECTKYKRISNATRAEIRKSVGGFVLDKIPFSASTSGVTDYDPDVVLETINKYYSEHSGTTEYYTSEYQDAKGFILASKEVNINPVSAVTVTESRSIKKSTLDSAIELFKNSFRDFVKFTQAGKPTERVKIPVNSNDIKLSTYLTLKSLYDKWLCSFNEAHWSLTKKNGEFDRFKFIDSYYNNIEDSLYMNVTEVGNAICNMMETHPDGGKDYSPSVYEFLQVMNQENNCILVESPAFNGFSTAQDVEDMFTPMPYSVMNNEEYSNPSYLWIYPHNPSEHLDIEDGDYADDGFDLADSLGNISPSLPKEIFDDNGKMIAIPAFGVSFGKQNQSVFKGYHINSRQFQTTEFSISNSIQIADSYGKSSEVASYVAQDLYKVYSNYSYSVDIEMMGCACISPMMYFQLNNIPLYKGAYRITKVSHDITPGNMVTKFTGVRLNKQRLPIVNDILLISDINEMSSNLAEDISTETTTTGNTYMKYDYSKYVEAVGEDIDWNTLITSQSISNVGNKELSVVIDVEKVGDATSGKSSDYAVLKAIGNTALKLGYQIFLNNVSNRTYTINIANFFTTGLEGQKDYVLFDMIVLAYAKYCSQIVMDLTNGQCNVSISFGKNNPTPSINLSLNGVEYGSGETISRTAAESFFQDGGGFMWTIAKAYDDGLNISDSFQKFGYIPEDSQEGSVKYIAYGEENGYKTNLATFKNLVIRDYFNKGNLNRTD